MTDYDSFEEFRDPETYDLECDSYTDDRTIVEHWAKSVNGPLLDLGCGTGRMAIHLTGLGHQVIGVDVVPEMIGKAREKAAAHKAGIEFVVSDARSFHLNKEFDFIFMLMHVFQFLLTREDHEALFACVREHLTAEGYFLFVTRNPNAKNLTELRHPEGETYILPEGGRLDIDETHYYDPMTQIQHYTRQLKYQYDDGRHVEKTLRTALRYVYPQEMEALLHYNGLKVHTCYGDWKQNPPTDESPSMIYVCQKRD